MAKKKNKGGRPRKKPTTVICFRVPEENSEAIKAEAEVFVKFKIQELAKIAKNKS